MVDNCTLGRHAAVGDEIPPQVGPVRGQAARNYNFAESSTRRFHLQVDRSVRRRRSGRQDAGARDRVSAAINHR